MKAISPRPTLLKRLVLFSSVECVLALMTIILAVIGMRSYFEFEGSAISTQVTPLPFIFGIWTFVAMFAVGICIAGWAVHKAR